MPSPELQSPASWMWKPCSCPGFKPLTSATTRTLSPVCVKVAVPLALLPFVGCRLAVALVPAGLIMLRQPAASTTTPISSALLISFPSPRGFSCSWPPPCPAPSRGRRLPWPWWLRPCRLPPPSPCRSSAAAPAAWPARRARPAGRRRRGRQGFSSSLLLHVRGARRHRAARGFALAGLDLLVPDLVVLARPALVDNAFAHRAVRAFDADRAHVDVAERDGDVDQRRDRVHRPRVLHHGARLVEVRKQQDQAAPGDEGAEQDDAAPATRLLAGVEAPGRDVLAAREPRPRPAEPQPVVGLGEVVAQEDDDRRQHRDDEQRRDEVVKVLAERGKPGEERVAHDRQQHVLAEEH